MRPSTSTLLSLLLAAVLCVSFSVTAVDQRAVDFLSRAPNAGIQLHKDTKSYEERVNDFKEWISNDPTWQQADQSAYEIRASPLGGIGLFAARNIPAGSTEMSLSEKYLW